MSACPICSSSADGAFECDGYPIHECKVCQHRFTPAPLSSSHVSDTYDDAYFFGGGAGYANYMSEEQLLLRHAQRYVDIIDQHATPGIMLDVGTAAGFTMEQFAASGWRTRGVEPNSKMAAIASERTGCDVRVGALESYDCDSPFDLITMIQVIAHFHDLNEAMHRAAALTRPGGFWLVETWNYRSLTARLFGRYWHEYSPPSVLHWFSPQSMTQLAHRHGMSTVARGRPKKRLDGAHAKSLLRYHCSQSAIGRLLRPLTHLLPNKMQLLYPADDLFWILLRKDKP